LKRYGEPVGFCQNIKRAHLLSWKWENIITSLECPNKMRITTLLTTTLLIGIAYAAMSAEITKCLDDIATQFSDADTKAQGIDLTSFIGLQSVRDYQEPSLKMQGKFG
jgi:hypothetical protein